jgi:hypothetical protein
MIRAKWWEEGRDEVPKDKRIVFGHYWNMPFVSGVHEAFTPPHPSGHPDLRAWFEAHHRSVPESGQVEVQKDVQSVCVDFNGVTRASDGAPLSWFSLNRSFPVHI